MSYQQCIDVIRQSAGELTDREIEQLAEELQRRQKLNMATGKFIDSEQAALAAADKMAQDMKLAAAIAKRETADNQVKFLKAISYLDSQWDGKPGRTPGEGIATLIYGGNKAVDSGRRSVMGYQNGTHAKLRGALFSDLLSVDKNAVDMLGSGQFDEALMKAMYDIRQGNKPTGSEFVPEIAQVLVKHQEYWRNLKNENGSWIGKRDDYIVSRSHNPTLIRKAGFDQWKADIEQHIDWEKTLAEMPDKDKDEFLHNVYKGFITGYHLKSGDEPSGFTGPANLAKRMSHERVLHFKGPEAEYAYAQKYASGGLGYQIMMSMEHTAQSVGLMKVLGANPGMMIRRIMDHVNETRETGVTPLEKHRIEIALKSVDGSMKTPVNDTLAKVTSYVITDQQASKLGGALLAQFGDLATRMMEFKRHGMNPLEGMASGIEGFLKGLGPAERREALLDIAGLSDYMTADMTRAAAVDPIGGTVAKGMDMFFRISGMHRWQLGGESASAVMMAQNLARRTVEDFPKLPVDLQVLLRQHGIGEAEWNVIRQGTQKALNDVSYLSPQLPKDLPNEAVHPLVVREIEALRERSKGEVSPEKEQRIYDRMKDELSDRLQNFFVDRIDFANVKPDAKTRAMMYQGTQPGTWMGAGMRMLMLFKAFPIGFLQKAMGASMYTSGANTMGEALTSPKAMGSVAQLILASTFFGYASMYAKDFMKGKEPRDPKDPKTLMAAMSQGGGFGIYGDFLFGEAKSRTGGAFLSTAAGPVYGALDDVSDIWRRIKNGDDAAAKTFSTALSNTPFMNVFYLRPVLDYMILSSMTEAMNPGALRRREALITKENDQGWWIRPSQNYLDPLGIAR